MLKNRIMMGGEEDNIDPKDIETKEPETTVVSESETKLAELEDQLKKQQEANKEMEQMLLDPSYTAFLAQQKKQDAEETDNKLEDMTNAELVTHIAKMVKDEISTTVTNLQTEHEQREGMKEIKRLMAKHDDYILYKPEMIRIAEENPTLTPERVYKLAKMEVGPRTKAAPKVSNGAVPNNQPQGAPPAPKGFSDQFETAWKKSNAEKVLKEVT